MVGKRDLDIEPMKIVVHPVFGEEKNGPGKTIACEVPTLVVKPLPPLPADIPAGSFHGAVGEFQFVVESPNVRFQKDEPTSLHFLLQGEGNFPEVNELAIGSAKDGGIDFEAGHQPGLGPIRQQGVRDPRITPHTDKDFDIPPATFVFFNPRRGAYETRTGAAIHFQFEPKHLSADETDHSEVVFDPPNESWSASHAIDSQIWFWVLQVLLAGGAATLVFKESRRRNWLRYLTSPRYARAKKWEKGQGGVASGARRYLPAAGRRAGERDPAREGGREKRDDAVAAAFAGKQKTFARDGRARGRGCSTRGTRPIAELPRLPSRRISFSRSRNSSRRRLETTDPSFNRRIDRGLREPAAETDDRFRPKNAAEAPAETPPSAAAARR